MIEPLQVLELEYMENKAKLEADYLRKRNSLLNKYSYDTGRYFIKLYIGICESNYDDNVMCFFDKIIDFIPLTSIPYNGTIKLILVNNITISLTINENPCKNNIIISIGDKYYNRSTQNWISYDTHLLEVMNTIGIDTVYLNSFINLMDGLLCFNNDLAKEIILELTI